MAALPRHSSHVAALVAARNCRKALLLHASSRALQR
jgi:hypothetical protein